MVDDIGLHLAIVWCQVSVRLDITNGSFIENLRETLTLQRRGGQERRLDRVANLSRFLQNRRYVVRHDAESLQVPLLSHP